MAWAICDSLGGTFATLGNTFATFNDSVNTARFSTNDAATFETFLDGGTGLNAIGFLQQGVYYIQAWTLAQANSAGLTAAQKTTLRNTCLQVAPGEVFGAGSYSLRSRIGDGFYDAWAEGASSVGTAAPNTMGYRASGSMLLDLPAFGDNLGGGYGIIPTLNLQTDLVTGLAWPVNITGSSTLTLFRLGDSVPVASLPWW